MLPFCFFFYLSVDLLILIFENSIPPLIGKLGSAPTTEIESIRDTYSILIALTKSAPKQYVPNEKQKKIVAGLSTVYFRKLFTDVCSVSPITYAHNLRIEKAKEMLKSDYGALSDVAISLGYSSIYDFSRDFKNHVGVSPSKYENT